MRRMPRPFILPALLLVLFGCPTETKRPVRPARVPAAPAAKPPDAAPKPALPPDRGIYPELAPRVRLHLPTWLATAPRLTVRAPRASYLYVAGVCVGLASGTPDIEVEGLGKGDADGDGIPDSLDFLIGAKKAALNGAAYTEGYRRLRYPGGDLPRTIGVCTDVVIRALRNAGLDLQRLVHEDIRRARRAYPMVRRVDPSINHRRVRSVLPYFTRHWRRLSADRDGKDNPLLPGDVVFMNTLGDERPDHLGVVSDRAGASGYPLVINNWTVGHRTSEMDLLGTVPVTHRFRMPAWRLPVAPEHSGLTGVLRRQGIPLPAGHGQVLLVTTPTWTSSGGELRRYQRTGGGWRQVGRTIDVRLGSKGLGRGRGLLEAALPGIPAAKREGDRRSPAGVFLLGTALGPQRRGPGRWPWRQTDARDRFVDDPASPHYNTWQRLPTSGAPRWKSAEKLAHYKLALLVRHNTDPVKPGAGSAIFLHTPAGGASVGCTTMARRDLLAILRWLRPDATPVLVQVSDQVL
jgi:uncharacterized protein YijF (DUF1287 family)/L,D-peptidoglycan transpeptidase YkuD (ErfK/YbiS/YcfS/YnhG family)